MKEGIYHVSFCSSQDQTGEGLAIIKDGKINGGDAGFLYLGQYTLSGDLVKATLAVKQWSETRRSIFGDLREFQLTLQGESDAVGTRFEVRGGTAQGGVQVRIRGSRLSDLA